MDMLIILAGLAACSWIGYLYGKAAGRDEVLDSQQEDVLTQGRRRDAIAAEADDAIRACSVCGGPMRRNGAGWEHTIPVAYAQDHRPTLA